MLSVAKAAARDASDLIIHANEIDRESSNKSTVTDLVTKTDKNAEKVIKDDILAKMDQPTIDGINTYFVSRAAASQGLKVAISGLGGDELFGGYPWRYYRVLHSLNEDDFLENYFEFWQRLTSLEQRQKLFKGAKEDHMEMFNVFSNTFALLLRFNL